MESGMEGDGGGTRSGYCLSMHITVCYILCAIG
jgi:hypothetical protein